MNRTREQLERGRQATTIWSVVTGMPGAALCAYCLSSIPAKTSFDGTLKGKHRAPGANGILDNRQLQM
ncbi:MAG TPA: hypothetical protein VGC66_06665 [Pyrinomonadaceae bacterium]